MDTYVFLGPTLPLEVARKHLDAVYCPPVQQGDLLKLLPRKPRFIGIIDGYFEVVPAVWHKEILYLMSRGVHVFGASSMGALRAAELHAFGMVGVGKIFEWYRSGELEDDDEVAVAHGPAESGYRALSEAMVNIREAIDAATMNGLMPASLGARFLSVAKNLHYSRRSFATVLAMLKSEMSNEQAVCLKEFFESHPKLKEVDAIALLQRIASFRASAPPRFEAGYTLERTVFLDAMINEAEQTAAESDAQSESGADGNTGMRGLMRHEVLLRLLARREATRLGMDCSEDELTEAARIYADNLTFADEKTIFESLDFAGIEKESFFSLMRDATLLDKLDQFYDRDINSQVADHIRIRSFRERNRKSSTE